MELSSELYVAAASDPMAGKDGVAKRIVLPLQQIESQFHRSSLQPSHYTELPRYLT